MPTRACHVAAVAALAVVGGMPVVIIVAINIIIITISISSNVVRATWRPSWWPE
jgi:hypothetical protein